MFRFIVNFNCNRQLSQEYTGVTNEETLQWSSEIHPSLWETVSICNASIVLSTINPSSRKGISYVAKYTQPEDNTYIIYVVLAIYKTHPPNCMEETLPTH